MNSNIVANLFELWSQVGKAMGTLSVTNEYKAVSVQNGDWPNRVFSVNSSHSGFEHTLKLIQKNLLPGYITLDKPHTSSQLKGFQSYLNQVNMAIKLDNYVTAASTDSEIKQVNSKQEAFYFAQTASSAFGYTIDLSVVTRMVKLPDIGFYNLIMNSKYVGCGVLYFDRNNNAGLHLIGTLPAYRRRGIGRKLTEHLLGEAKRKKKQFAVLQASAMGESLYKKLGFTAYGVLNTYHYPR